MRRKIILSTTIISLALAFALFCVGVYASMTQEFAMTNTIGFISANNVFCSFRGEVAGCKKSEATDWNETYQTKDEYLTAKGLKAESLFEEANRSDPDYLTSYSWVITEPVEFIDEETPIVYTIEITNFSEIKIKLTLSFKQNGSNISNAVACKTYGNSYLTNASQDLVIDNYASTRTIVLDEYVVGQTASMAAKCVFTITTTMGANARDFKEENNFSITAEKL